MKLTLSCRQLIGLYNGIYGGFIYPSTPLYERNVYRNLLQHLNKVMLMTDDFNCGESCLDCSFQYDLCDDNGDPIHLDGENI